MRKVVFDSLIYLVDTRLDDFEIYQKPSSNVAFFGIGLAGQRFFIQFKNGTSYIFSEVPISILTDAVTADSIGKFFNANIARTYPSVKIEARLITEEVSV